MLGFNNHLERLSTLNNHTSTSLKFISTPSRHANHMRGRLDQDPCITCVDIWIKTRMPCMRTLARDPRSTWLGIQFKRHACVSQKIAHRTQSMTFLSCMFECHKSKHKRQSLLTSKAWAIGSPACASTTTWAQALGTLILNSKAHEARAHIR